MGVSRRWDRRQSNVLWRLTRPSKIRHEFPEKGWASGAFLDVRASHAKVRESSHRGPRSENWGDETGDEGWEISRGTTVPGLR